jgi:hypothetical protein
VSVIDWIFWIRIGDGTIVIFALDIGAVAGKDFEESGWNIWLARAGCGTIFAWGVFWPTNELELETDDSGGFVTFEVEDR